jgi:ribosomal protein L34E
VGELWTLPSDVARMMAARRKPKVRQCEECGAEFTTVGRGRFCRALCRLRAARKRAKARSESEEARR